MFVDDRDMDAVLADARQADADFRFPNAEDTAAAEDEQDVHELLAVDFDDEVCDEGGTENETLLTLWICL